MAFFTLFQLIFIDPVVFWTLYVIHIDYGYVEIHRRYKSLTKLLSFFYTLGAKKLFKSTDAFVLFCFFSLARRSSRWARLVTNSRHQFIYQNFFVFFFVWTKAAIYYVAVLRRFMVMTIHASCSGWQFQNRKKKKLLAYLNQVRERESGSASY